MSSQRFNMLPSINLRRPSSAVLAAGFVALGLVWALAPAMGPSSLMMRLGILAAGLAVVGVGSFVTGPQRENPNSLDALNQLDPAKTTPDEICDALPELPTAHPWQTGLARLKESLQAQSERLVQVEQARAGAELRARRMAFERDQFREILSGLPDPLIVVDHYGEITLANARAEQILGLNKTDQEHPALEQMTRCQELVHLLAETRRRRATAPRHGEVALPGENGQLTTYKITCKPLAGREESPSAKLQGAPQGALAVLTDISGLKAVQKRQAEFVSAVSHEMKTPLASIKAYVELLADGDAEDKATQEEFFRIINGQTERLQRLIENLLSLARIEAGVVQVNKTPRSLNELLLEAIHVLQPAAEQKNITLIPEMSPLYLGVLADRDTLLQAAINLISNAIKYTHSGGKVTVRSRLSDQDVIFEVQDSGVGLSPEDRQKVFEKFYRVKKDKEMAQGTGLGLPLVKHIVEDIHRGRIEVESELGVGSTFRVVLPSVAQMGVS